MKHLCCDAMKAHAYFLDNNTWFSGDTADKIVYCSDKYREYGIPVKTDRSPIATSYITISYCPWCGKKLPNSLRAQRIAVELFETVRSDRKSAYQFLYDRSELASICIVEIMSEAMGNEEPTVKTLAHIDDLRDFIACFEKVPCYLTKEDSHGIQENDTAIKITYKNGDYELIDKLGQARYTQADQFTNDIGCYCFDVNAYRTLLSRYLSDDAAD